MAEKQWLKKVDADSVVVTRVSSVLVEVIELSRPQREWRQLYHSNNLLPGFTSNVGVVERAAYLCDREEMLIDFERRSLARAARRSSETSNILALEERARALAARVDRAAHARSQIDFEPQATSQIFRRRTWNGVRVPVGAQLTNGYAMLFGTIFLFPIVYYGAGFARYGIDSIHSANHVARFVKAALAIFWVLGSLASVLAIAILLGLYIEQTRKVNWVLFFIYMVTFLWLASGPRHS